MIEFALEVFNTVPFGQQLRNGPKKKRWVDWTPILVLLISKIGGPCLRGEQSG